MFSTASEPLELQDALGRDSKWYTHNRLTLNVKKTKLMLAGSKTVLSKFENFELLPYGGQINRVKSFKYLGVTIDEKRNWKCHIKTLPLYVNYAIDYRYLTGFHTCLTGELAWRILKV